MQLSVKRYSVQVTAFPNTFEFFFKVSAKLRRDLKCSIA